MRKYHEQNSKPFGAVRPSKNEVIGAGQFPILFYNDIRVLANLFCNEAKLITTAVQMDGKILTLFVQNDTRLPKTLAETMIYYQQF